MAESSDLTLDFTLKELVISTRPEDAGLPGSSATVPLQERRLACVEYPAVVRNVDKMLETLGGEKAMTKIYSHPKRRLELRYRPHDPFSHSLCANRSPSSNLLLRVRRRVRKKDPRDTQVHIDALGVIGTTYKFQGLADFQCLAVHADGGKSSSLYDKILLHQSQNQQFFEEPIPYFLPPAIFSRLDSPVDYFYRHDLQHNQGPAHKKNFISLTRARRPHNAVFVSYNEAVVPAEALEAAKVNWERVCLKETDKQTEIQLKQMFESRPIWSRNAVKANIEIHPDKLKLLLPLVAYYMVTGPWRSLWVRLGYDPRKSPESKKYQILDFRIRCSSKHGYSLSDMPVKAKRSSFNYTLPIAISKVGPQAASLLDLPVQEGPSGSRESLLVKYQLKESSYIFREGMLPPHRQMFYQLCDLDVDSIKTAFERNDGKESGCDERDGWCVLGTTDELRDMMSAMIKKVIRAQKPSMPDLPKKRRRRGLHERPPEAEEDEEEEEELQEEELQEEEIKEDQEEDEDEFQPSEGSENEMETEILDYI
ncbi:general transcription factor 3C polypeptide 5 [Genypterus blacodes]|uniref:general transcription factor 3C polypeptide 5 n=1 Tax=Genypterus blacodes TaxID=154954 RepID=UPI003F759B80